MNKFVFTLLFAGLTAALAAQDAEPYEFKEYKMLPVTSVKSQDQTGTCWSFSTTSFLESEALRQGKGQHNLSEMYIVRNVYHQKCENFVRRLGKAQFGEGGLAHDELNALREYGAVPESVYPGRKDPSKPFNHTQLVQRLQAMCLEYIAQAKRGALPENWLAEIDRVLDEEFGPVPAQFTEQNILFTPVSYRDYLGLNADDYVNITSFTHHPFWTGFILEVPDNFAGGQYFNMPLGDLMRCLNYSLQQGYTVEWDADVSNAGFAARHGLAIVPEVDQSSKSKEQLANTFKYWEPEKAVDQAYRQKAFDRLETQDDHLMHIVGMLNEVHGGSYYVVKNSWGEISELKGFLDVSEAYMRLNTLSFTVNKKALPQDIRIRMGLEEGEIRIENPAAPATDSSSQHPPHNPSPYDRDKAPGKLPRNPNPALATDPVPPKRMVVPAKD